MKPKVICFIMGLLFIGCNEYVESHFQDASDNGYLKSRGWLPEYVPNNSSDVYEMHDLDTNQSIIKFSVSNTTNTEFLNESDQTKQVSFPSENFARSVKWWPQREIKSNVQSGKWDVRTKISGRGIQHYICKGDRGVIYMWSFGKGKE